MSARIAGLVVGCGSFFLLLAFLSYHPADVPLLSSEPNMPVGNIGGQVGAWLGLLGRGGFGWASLVFPVLGGVLAWRLWRGESAQVRWTSWLVASVCLLASLGTLAALQTSEPTRQVAVGGVVGHLIARAGRYYLGTLGTALAALCVALLSGMVVSGQAVLTLTVRGLTRLWGLLGELRWMWRRLESPKSLERIDRTTARPIPPSLEHRKEISETPAAAVRDTERPVVRIRSTVEPKSKPVSTTPRRVPPDGFHLPSIELLATPPPVAERQLTEDLQTNAKILQETLREFGIEASVADIDRGPTVTRYELLPAPGVKLTKIVSLADDLALVLKAASCHVVAPIPGKGRVGVDVPNSTATTVYLKEVLTSREFQAVNPPLALAIGKDIAGHAVVCDLRECPHLLIAGATGSGKTVCLNSLLIGLLFHASPEQVKFLMIDPKKVELSLFNDIPHLAAPVVADSKKAAAVLHWAVQEMERRYQLLAKAGVRNIDAFNRRGRSASEEPEDESLPYLVLVIDELADLMIVATQEVEEAITRLSQLSRAVGIHIILATQRPSVDVITGVIKANFPARIAFQVASKVDSRTILDVNGADKLVGRGDLLFLRPGTAKPIRAQSALITDEEIERIVDFVKAQAPPSYNEELLSRQERPHEFLDIEKDELYEKAKQIVIESGQASTSLLQRRLRLGYARAARMLDLMEQEGLVGPPQGSRPREVLVSASSGGPEPS